MSACFSKFVLFVLNIWPVFELGPRSNHEQQFLQLE